MDPIHQKEAEKGCGNSVWVEHASTKSLSSDAEPDKFLLEGAGITKLEKRLLRKIDLNILPLMAISMFVSFLVCYHVLKECSGKNST